MSYTQIDVTRPTPHVARVFLNRPEVRNAFNETSIRELAQVFAELSQDTGVRAIVLGGHGKAFCAGADLVAPDGIAGKGMGGINALYDQAVRLFSVETPIVAAVQGAAVGAGLGLALIADFRVAAPEARFTANFVKLGFHPGVGLTHTLPRLIGQQRANLMFLTGRRVKAEEALAWGLVDEVAPLADLLSSAQALAAEIAENAPLAVLATRKTLRQGLADAVRAQTNHEHAEQTILRATEDFAEGVRAVQERRPGRFTGR